MARVAKASAFNPSKEDLAGNGPLDLGIATDEKEFLEALANPRPNRKRETGLAEIAAAGHAYAQKLEKQFTRA